MFKKLIPIFVFLLLIRIASASITPPDNYDYRDYYNLTRANYIQGSRANFSVYENINGSISALELWNTTEQIRAAQLFNTTADIRASQLFNTTSDIRSAQLFNTTADIRASQLFNSTTDFFVGANNLTFLRLDTGGVITGNVSITAGNLTISNGGIAAGTSNMNFAAHTFAEYGVTPETLAGPPAARTLAMFGNGAAYFAGRDVTNDIEFAFGTSIAGRAFLGSMTNHGLDLRTNNDPKIIIDTSGNVNITTGNLSAIGVKSNNYYNSTGQLEWITPANILDVDDEDIEGDLNTYVDIAGDTMTGNLNAPSAVFTTGINTTSGDSFFSRGTTSKRIQINNYAVMQEVATDQLLFGSNMYYNGSDMVYLNNNFAGGFRIYGNTGDIYIDTAPSGIAGQKAYNVHRLRIRSNGNTEIVNGTFNVTLGNVYVPAGNLSVKDTIDANIFTALDKLTTNLIQAKDNDLVFKNSTSNGVFMTLKNDGSQVTITPTIYSDDLKAPTGQSCYLKVNDAGKLYTADCAP